MSEEIFEQSSTKKRMPRWLKVTLISLSSLIGLVVVVALIALYHIFTPERLTTIVNKLSDKYITCESHFESVDLSLFRTFPNAGLKVNDVVLVNPVEGYNQDTLASMHSLIVAINVRDFIKNGDIKVEQILVDDILANAYIAKDGTTNFDIFPPSADTTESESKPFELPDTIDLRKIKVSNLRASLTDLRDGMKASVRESDLCLKVSCLNHLADAKLRVSSEDISVILLDSLNKETLSSQLSDIKLNLKGEGWLNDMEGKLHLDVDKALFSMGGTAYVNEELQKKDKILKIDMPFKANLDDFDFTLSDASIALVDYVISLEGNAKLATEEHPLMVDATFETNKWQISDLLPLIPFDIKGMMPKGMNLDAAILLKGKACGSMTDTTMPLVSANIQLTDGRLNYREVIPYEVRRINGDIDAILNLSDDGISSAVVNNLTASVSKSNLNLTGRINDLLGNLMADVNLKGNLHLPDVKPFIPKDLGLEAKGKANVNFNLKATLDQITNLDLKSMNLKGSIGVKNLDVNMNNDIMATSPDLNLDIQIPAKKHTATFKEMLSARITVGSLHADIVSSNIHTDLSSTELEAGICDIMDESLPFMVAATLKANKLDATMDSMSATLSEPDIAFEMVPDKNDPSKVHYQVNYNNSALYAKISDSLSLDFAGLSVKGSAYYDSTRSNVLQQWSPDFDIDLKRAYVNFSQLNYMVQVPDIKFNYKPEKCEIASANVVFGNSDFYLSGAVTGLEKWISHEGMLKGDLYFTSNYTNVDDLLEALSGMGSDPDTLQKQREEDHVSKEANPFIVPKDVVFTLHTRIKDCTAFGNDLQELAGDVKVNDGVAVLDQVGFVCKAATMQLTALYRSPRVNHIFLGLDFHLLDIGVHELIDMIPAVDTIVPMLSSFDGNANFHLCAETYVNAFYQPKYSTLRGAASISGDSLVVLDSETFNTISKYLMFNKKTKNVIDSLDVEMTVFRKEVELFPFLLSMDKYQVVAAGRHNLDMNYDYHLEIIRSPLPTRLAVDALGIMPKIGIKLSKCRYDGMFRPEKRNAVQQQTLNLKQMIRSSLEANVKESTKKYRGLED